MTMRRMGVWAAATMGLALAGCGDAAKAPAKAPDAASAPAPSTDSGRPGERTFRDWHAACDNVDRCAAFGFAAEGGSSWVRIALDAGPLAQPSVTFGTLGDGEGKPQPLTVEVDGRAFPVEARPMADVEPLIMAGIDGAGTRGLLDALGQGRVVTIVSGAQRTNITLSGAAASLLWIDERQGRLDTNTALFRVGPRPATTVPAAPTPPLIVPAAAVGQRGYGDQEGQTLPAALEADAAVVQCRADTEFNPDLQKVISSARLGPDTVLWGVPCGSGAYNLVMAWFTTRADGTNPRRISFPTTGQPLDFLVNAAFDPATRTLDAFDKSRGIGDCGTATSWTWTDRGFVLKASSAMSECAGVPSELWPSFWTTAG